MASLSRQVLHDLPEMPKFVVAQPPIAALHGELSNALRRVLADNLQAGGMPEKPAQRPNRPARHAQAARRLAAPAGLPTSRRLAGGYIGLHRLDVAQGQTAD
jgi:hypothetical protein